jgi:lipopolysaccharide biosynthesis glycosyltransferase
MLTDQTREYGVGALVLMSSIRRRTRHLENTDFLILELESKPVADPALRQRLLEAGWTFLKVPRIAPADEANTATKFRDQFTKLILWNLTQYTDRIVYLDSDCMVVGKLDSLLTMDLAGKALWAARDFRGWNWQDTFNLGVFVIRPDSAEFLRLMSLREHVQFETRMAEQGFLNVVYKSSWGELAFNNNANLAAFKVLWGSENIESLNVIHFTVSKPWRCAWLYTHVCRIWWEEKDFLVNHYLSQEKLHFQA